MKAYKIINHNNNGASYEVSANSFTQAIENAKLFVSGFFRKNFGNYQGTANALRKVTLTEFAYQDKPDFTIQRIK